jgi:hypothetical protein
MSSRATGTHSSTEPASVGVLLGFGGIERDGDDLVITGATTAPDGALVEEDGDLVITDEVTIGDARVLRVGSSTVIGL